MFVLDPIIKIFKLCMADKVEEVFKVAERLNVKLADEEKDSRKQALLTAIMRKWLPLSNAVLQALIIHLPSPWAAQAYRAEVLYDGPASDEAFEGIRNCDPTAPLMLHVSKMVPSSEKGKFYAFGRVFSGTVQPGQRVRVQGPNFKAAQSQIGRAHV